MKKKKQETLFNKHGKVFASCMVIIAIVHFCIWYVYLNYESVLLAFTPSMLEKNFTLMYFEKFFDELRMPGTILYGAFLNTMKYFFWGIIKLIVSYLIAYFFYKKVYLHNVYKFVFYLPCMFSSLVYISVFKGVIETNGPIYVLLKKYFDYEMPHLLSNGATATPVILFYGFWSGFGTSLMIYVGSMNRIPGEVLESARLDGCNWFKEFIYMVLPLTLGLFLTYFLFAIAGIFMASGEIFYFTGMNEFLGTYTINFYIYAQTRAGQVNYAAAIGLIISIVTLPIVLLTRWIATKIDAEVTY